LSPAERAETAAELVALRSRIDARLATVVRTQRWSGIPRPPAAISTACAVCSNPRSQAAMEALPDVVAERRDQAEERLLVASGPARR